MLKSLLQIDLNDRRKRLGMSCANVAERSGVSLPTVQRIMAGRCDGVAFANVFKVAEAVGVSVELSITTDAETTREQEARRKAERLVRMAQATSALEAQGVDAETLRRTVDRITQQLLASNRKLWAA